jgi:uncharacterized Zn-binding protein involved in type VI secretion
MAGHGGAITGPPVATVLIGGMPAANMGSMYACPAVTVLVPHVGGPFAAGSTTVFIGGMPALRVGDLGAVPTCPGGAILPPGCPTVLIGG